MLLNGNTVGLMMEPTLVPYGRNKALYSCELSLLRQKLMCREQCLWKRQGERILHSLVVSRPYLAIGNSQGRVLFISCTLIVQGPCYPSPNHRRHWYGLTETDLTQLTDKCLLTPKCRHHSKTSEREERSIISEIGKFWSCASKQLTRSYTRPSHLLSKPPAKAEGKNFTFVTILSKVCVKVFVFNSKTRHQDWVWSELTGAGKPTSTCSIKVSFWFTSKSLKIKQRLKHQTNHQHRLELLSRYLYLQGSSIVTHIKGLAELY